eukprot:COSAG06_NODE_27135_length_600_cov_0.682635_2_plen_40_part_01
MERRTLWYATMLLYNALPWFCTRWLATRVYRGAGRSLLLW